LHRDVRLARLRAKLVLASPPGSRPPCDRRAGTSDVRPIGDGDRLRADASPDGDPGVALPAVRVVEPPRPRDLGLPAHGDPRL